MVYVVALDSSFYLFIMILLSSKPFVTRANSDGFCLLGSHTE